MKSQLNFILCLLSLTILSVFLYKACCKSLNTKYFNNTPKQHRINCVIKKIKADNCGIQKQSEEPFLAFLNSLLYNRKKQRSDII